MLEIKYTLNYKFSHRLHNCEININTRHTIIIKLCNYEIKLGLLKQKIQNGQNFLREQFVLVKKTNLLVVFSGPFFQKFWAKILSEPKFGIFLAFLQKCKHRFQKFESDLKKIDEN